MEKKGRQHHIKAICRNSLFQFLFVVVIEPTEYGLAYEEHHKQRDEDQRETVITQKAFHAAFFFLGAFLEVAGAFLPGLSAFAFPWLC